MHNVNCKCDSCVDAQEDITLIKPEERSIKSSRGATFGYRKRPDLGLILVEATDRQK